MKCSLKDAFINILFIVFIIPSEGVEFPLFFQKSSVIGDPMNFRQFRAALNRLQDLDSFPHDGDSENKLHKIVKKQMAVSESKNSERKRSVFALPFGETHGGDLKEFQKTKKAVNTLEVLKPSEYSRNNHQTDAEFYEEFVGKVNNYSKRKRSLVSKPSTEPPPVEEKKQDPPLELKPNEESLNDTQIPSPDLETEIQQEISNGTKAQKPDIDIEMMSEAEEKSNVTQIQPEPKKSEPKGNEKNIQKHNKNFQKKYTRIPDERDHRYYYECESKPFGIIQLRRKRCPDGQFFSFRQLKCMRLNPVTKLKPESNSETNISAPKPQTNNTTSKPEINIKQIPETDLDSKPQFEIDSKIKRNPEKISQSKVRRRKRNLFVSKVMKPNLPERPPDESDPSNEWLDVTQGSKIPPEFKPVKKPELKIYHLIVKKKLGKIVRKVEKRNVMGGLDSSNSESRNRNIETAKGPFKRQMPKTHRARSFLIRIHKKIGKDEESVTENEENDNEEEEEDDSDDEDEEEESDDEEEEEESDEDVTDITQKSEPSAKETLKDLFKSAKEAVTNRARFNESPLDSRIIQKSISPLKSEKFGETGSLKNKSKQVLIDANIKVDSTIGNALKSVLKSKSKGDHDINSNIARDDEALISDRGSQDQMDPELIRMYENLLRHNPRVKRYFLANCAKSGN